MELSSGIDLWTLHKANAAVDLTVEYEERTGESTLRNAGKTSGQLVTKEKILGSLEMDLQVPESAETWHRMLWANQAEQLLRKNDGLGLVSAKRSLSYYLFVVVNGCCCHSYFTSLILFSS